MPPNLIERVHTPAFLQGIALNFPTPQLIADRVAPRRRVNKQSDKYRKFGKDALYQYESTWAPGAIPNAIKTELSEDQYFAELRKLRHQLLDTEVRNADNDIDLRTLYTERVTAAIRIAREQRVANLFRTAGNYPGGNVITKAGAAEWDAAGVINTVQPITDLENIIGAVSDSALVSRDMLTVVIPEQVFRKALRHNSAIRDYFKYTQGGVMTQDILAALLGVREVVVAVGQAVAPGVQNAGTDIITGITTTYLWGDDVWVGVAEGVLDTEYTFAQSFNWTEETGGQEIQIRQYRSADEGQELDWIEAKEAIGEKIVANFAGGLIKNTLA